MAMPPTTQSTGGMRSFTLRGDHLLVNVALGINDNQPPYLTYQDAHQVRSFTGDEITLDETALGLLVTVTTLTSDIGNTTFTLILPTGELTAGHHPGSLLGITAMHLRAFGDSGPNCAITHHLFGSQFTYEHMDL